MTHTAMRRGKELGQYISATIAVGVVNWQGPNRKPSASGLRTSDQRGAYRPPPRDQRDTHVLVACLWHRCHRSKTPWVHARQWRHKLSRGVVDTPAWTTSTRHRARSSKLGRLTTDDAHLPARLRVRAEGPLPGHTPGTAAAGPTRRPPAVPRRTAPPGGHALGGVPPAPSPPPTGPEPVAP